MENFKDAIALLNAQRDIIDAAEAEQARIRDEAVQKFCPVKVGDVVAVNSYSHKGKHIKVDRIHMKLAWGGKHGGFVASGLVLKKDGTPGLNRGEHYVAAPA